LTFADLVVVNGLAARYSILQQLKRKSQGEHAEMYLIKQELADYNVDPTLKAKARK
jgi:hypothetical protein